MKKLKKLAGFMLALVMVCAMGVTALADDSGGETGGETGGTTTTTTYSITIKNETADYSYTAYQIFSGNVSSDGTSMTDVVWGNAIVEEEDNKNQTAALAAVVAIELADGSTPFKSCTSAAEIAAVLSEKGNDSEIVKEFAQVIAKYVTVVAGTCTTQSDGAYTISNLAEGYYLVKTTGLPESESVSEKYDGSYTRYILTIVGGSETEVEVETKSAVPTIDKAIAEEDIVANINDTINYTLTATLPSNYSDYEKYTLIFHDVMSSGLTFDGTDSVTVTVINTVNGEEKKQVVKDDGYSVVKKGDENVKDTTCTFEVQIADTNSLKEKDTEEDIEVSSTSKIIVTFTATLNKNAVIGGDGNPNEIYLEYSNNPNSGGEGSTGFTPKDKVVTWTLEVDVTKFTKTTEGGTEVTKYLEGAVFVLYNSDNEYVTVDTDNKVTGWVDSVDNAAELTSAKDTGLFSIIGLDEGVYYLKEITAPEGYNKLSAPIKITITATKGTADTTGDVTSLTNLTATADSDIKLKASYTTGVVAAEVENSSGYSLPGTGGIGTTIFYVIGTVLVLGAAVLLVTRRRMGNAE